MKRMAWHLGWLFLGGCLLTGEQGPRCDLVLRGGRILDPETGLDAVIDVGVRDGQIVALGEAIEGRVELDATGCIVAPGFIDALTPAITSEGAEYKIFDGVTTCLRMEGGPLAVGESQRRLEGEGRPVHFGTVVGLRSLRRAVGITDRYAAATPAMISSMQELAATAFEEGALGIGFGIQYEPGASREEIAGLFRVAATYGLTCQVHVRYSSVIEPHTTRAAVEEVIEAARASGVRARILHLTSMGSRRAAELLELLDRARQAGVDIDANFYPYNAWMTDLRSAVFDPGWREREGIDYADLESLATGERLTAETFAHYRREATEGVRRHFVIGHGIPEDAVRAAARHPLTTVASDGMVYERRGHPRAAGTFARWIGRYALREGVVPLREALAKVTYRAADRLANTSDAFPRKGRIQVGCDADIVVFDPERFVDQATYGELRMSSGVVHLLVGGTPVIVNGERVFGVHPGRWIRGRLAGP